MANDTHEKSPDSPPSKKIKTSDSTESEHHVEMNSAYNEDEFKTILIEAINSKQKHTFDNGAKIISEPFTCCVLPNFIESKEFVETLRKQLEEVDVALKISDLYQFKQSIDLGSSKVPEIAAFKNFLYGKVLKWMQVITNIDLTNQVDMSCSCYTYTDHLLCHDDELEGRRIAYIYYLVPDWDEKYGGMLDLFNTVHDEPSKVVTSFVPAYNQLIFFEVGPTSFHQVSEILAYKTRTSISGWFYGPPIEPANHQWEPTIFLPPVSTNVDIKQWINSIYLQPETQLSIRDSFEESSEIELTEFLQPDKYDELCKVLSSEEVKWKKIGPPSRRRFQELPTLSDVPQVLKDCQDLFCSEPFLLVLSNLTGLHLHPACEEGSTVQEPGQTKCTVRRWEPGSYTLLHDQSFCDSDSLVATLCFNCPDWGIEYGGYTSYVTKDEEEELLRVDPKPNSLALVYITEGTAHFVKYINCRASERSSPSYQDIFTLYRESEDSAD